MPAITLPADVIKLADNLKWVNRFQIVSESSNRIYIIAQHRKRRFWGCTCRSWTIRRECKHLALLRLPGREMPYEVDMILERQPVTELDDSEQLSPMMTAPQIPPVSEDPEIQRLLNRINERTNKLRSKKPEPESKPRRRFSLDEDV